MNENRPDLSASPVNQTVVEAETAIPPGTPKRRRLELTQMIRRFPVTFSLIGITLLVFLLQLLSEYFLGVDLVLYYGAKINSEILRGQIWRLVTPLFIHAGILHFAVNMYSLYAIGPTIEQYFSRNRFLYVYIISGVGGVLLSFFFSSNPSVGASSAIFGLIGTLGGFLFLHRKVLNVRDQLQRIISITVINLIIGMSPGIDNWGHVGGLIAGIILSFVIGPRYRLVQTLQGLTVIDQKKWSTLRRESTLIVLLLAMLVMLLINPFAN